MSRGRFGLLLTLLVLVLGTASFVAVLSLLDDTPRVPAADATTTTSETTTTQPGGLVTPTFVAVVSSEVDRTTAGAMVDELSERGYDSGLLHSDDHTSLEPGFWVAYVGPFPDSAEAQSATERLVADGYASAYPRCVGTAEECG